MSAKYWDYINGKITDDNNYAEIVDGGLLYIESYEVFGNMRFDIAYTQYIKDNGNLYDFRESRCKEQGIELNQLGRLVWFAVPTKIYNEIYGTEESGKTQI